MTTRNSPRKAARAQGRHPSGRTQKARPAPRWRNLGNLPNEPDDHPRFRPLKAQMLASLEHVVDMAEARLNKLVDTQARDCRGGFRLIKGGRATS
jgi:hypothetical protein